MRRLAFSAVSLLLFALPGFSQWKLDDAFKVQKPEDKTDVASTKPPEKAIVLFDGKSMDAWVKRDGKSNPGWKIVDSNLEAVKGQGDIISKQRFDGKFKLHVEFRVPYEPELKQGQGRGNSGVYLQGRYEVQILDSYGIKSGKNDCASIYDIHAPIKNVCKAPTVWQSYDIDFTSPQFDAAGKKTKPVQMTVYHNGTLVQDHMSVNKDNTTSGMGGDPKTPGPIMLQEHGHRIQFRNVWLLPIQ
ncbi:MAG: DUF1080 domain-containing protein [Gemmataceae bacterium]